MFNPIERACQYLITHANYTKDSKGKLVPKSLGKCAQYVRQAVDFGFNSEGKSRKVLRVVGAAKNCGKAYEEFGFKKIFSFPEQDRGNYHPKIGDVCIIQYEPFGHICMKTPKGWVSDFVQIDHFGGSIRKKNPPFAIYRFENEGTN